MAKSGSRPGTGSKDSGPWSVSGRCACAAKAAGGLGSTAFVETSSVT